MRLRLTCAPKCKADQFGRSRGRGAVNAWGQQIGASRGALRVWCKTAGVAAHSCLDFLRVLRAVVVSRTQAWDLFSLLDVVDQRSLIKLLDRGGVRDLCRAEPPTIDDFLRCQQYVDNQMVLLAVTHRLNEDRD